MAELSKIEPNTFQTPNTLCDDGVMAALTGNETKCYLAVVRKTLGWHKTKDRISKSLLMQITGLGREAVDSCMDALVEYGLVLRLEENDPKNNHGILWGLQTDDRQIKYGLLNLTAKKNEKEYQKRMGYVRRAGTPPGGQTEGMPGSQRGGMPGGQATQKPLSKATNKNHIKQPGKNLIEELRNAKARANTRASTR